MRRIPMPAIYTQPKRAMAIESLQDFVERKREKGIYLSVLGFGQGNYQDAMMQALAQKVLVTEATSNLFPIAKDVKIQVEFATAAAKSSEYAFLRLRYKLPTENKSNLIERPIGITNNDVKNSTYQQEANFATAVAGFAQLLRGSSYTGDFTYDKVIELAQANKGKDEYGYRTEFIQLVRKAKIAQ